MTDNTNQPSNLTPDSPKQGSNKRRVLTGTLAAIAVFAVTSGASWAITRDRSTSDDDTVTEAIAAAPLVDDNGEPITVDPDYSSSRVALPHTRTIAHDVAFDAIAATAVLGADDTGTGTVILDTPIEGTLSTEGPTDDTTGDAGSTASTGSTTSTPVPSSSVPGTTDDSGDSGDTPTTTPDIRSWRFIDPCADHTERCAALAGGVTMGATVLPLVDDPVLPPVKIRSISASGGKSKGCSPDEVPQGRRAIEVTVNRPASLELHWQRNLLPAAQAVHVTPVPAALREYREDPSRGWTTCVDMVFPTDLDRTGASLVVKATVADRTSDTKVQFVYDDDVRRLLVFSAGKSDEVIAMTPKIGDVRLAAVALGAAEDEPTGCARAAQRVLPRNPAPGTEALRGEVLSDDLAATLAPNDKQWVAARFTNLGEAERYAVCMFSIGTARGNLNGAVEATDAVLVQPPNRERYEIQPVSFERKRATGRRGFSIKVEDTSALCSWTKFLSDDDPARQDLRGDFRPCEIGRLDTADQVIGKISTNYDKTSISYLNLPAHCIRTSDCKGLGVVQLRSLDVPGPSYGPNVCGATGASCDGVRPRGVLDGILTVSVKRIESPVGPESWTIGPSKRVDVNIPQEFYELVDFTHSSLLLGVDGQIIARVHTLVPTNVTLYPMTCDGGVRRTLDPMVSVLLSTDHYFELPVRLDVGHCMTAGVMAVDPTGELHDNTDGMFPQVWRTE